jgi:hypothetical protein
LLIAPASAAYPWRGFQSAPEPCGMRLSAIQKLHACRMELLLRAISVE